MDRDRHSVTMQSLASEGYFMSNQPMAQIFGYKIDDFSSEAQRHRLCPFNNKVPNLPKIVKRPARSDVAGAGEGERRRESINEREIYRF